MIDNRSSAEWPAMDTSFKSTVKKSANEPGVNPPRGKVESTCAVNRCTVEEPRGQRLSSLLDQVWRAPDVPAAGDSRVRAHLRADRSEPGCRIQRRRDAGRHDMVGGDDAVSQIAFGCRAGTYGCVGLGKHCDFICVDMDRVHRSEVGAEKPFFAEKLYWSRRHIRVNTQRFPQPVPRRAYEGEARFSLLHAAISF